MGKRSAAVFVASAAFVLAACGLGGEDARQALAERLNRCSYAGLVEAMDLQQSLKVTGTMDDEDYEDGRFWTIELSAYLPATGERDTYTFGMGKLRTGEWSAIAPDRRFSDMFPDCVGVEATSGAGSQAPISHTAPSAAEELESPNEDPHPPASEVAPPTATDYASEQQAALARTYTLDGLRFSHVAVRFSDQATTLTARVTNPTSETQTAIPAIEIYSDPEQDGTLLTLGTCLTLSPGQSKSITISGDPSSETVESSWTSLIFQDDPSVSVC